MSSYGSSHHTSLRSIRLPNRLDSPLPSPPSPPPQVASPVEEYLLLIDAMPSGPEKEKAAAMTRPYLDFLGRKYALPLEGAGLFPLQASLNHSCEPNVTLIKVPPPPPLNPPYSFPPAPLPLPPLTSCPT